jgi:transcriptional regulator with XRE-family HTH domain
MTETPSDAVARQIQQIRKRRSWSAKRLAQECAGAGAEHLTESVIANIESGRRDQHGRRRRDVTVDELVSLAQVLKVPVLQLLPETVSAGAAEYLVTSSSSEDRSDFIETLRTMVETLTGVIPARENDDG